MFRLATRSATAASSFRALPRQTAARRFVSTGATGADKRGGYKSFVARWGLAGAAVYYYNTSSAFAEEPVYVVHSPPETSHESETYPTIDSIAEKRRTQARSQLASSPTTPTASESITAVPDAEPTAAGSPGDLEEEAGQQGAFNEETGEINWDCPCLGGMANGPCGEQFRAAFSCFVYSKEEPKGVDCIEHFKTMQNCFREHPDVYGAELDGDEAPPPEGAFDGQPGDETSGAPSLANVDSPHQGGEKVAHTQPDTKSEIAGKRERAEAATKQVERDHNAVSESESAVPKAWHDSTENTTEK